MLTKSSTVLSSRTISLSKSYKPLGENRKGNQQLNAMIDTEGLHGYAACAVTQDYSEDLIVDLILHSHCLEILNNFTFKLELCM